MKQDTLATAFMPRLDNRPTVDAFAQQKDTGGYRTLTWQQFRDQVLQLSSYLQSRGIGPGHRVLILSDNCPEWGIAAFAVFNQGATLVPVAAMSTARELANVIQRSQPEFCFFSASAVAFRQSDTATLPPHFAWDPQLREPIAELIQDQPRAELDPNKANPDSPALLIYTSGTTGTPKGVPLSHRNILINVMDVKEEIDATDQDVVVSVLPLSHVFEFTGGFLLPMWLGARVCYVKSLRAEDIMGAMKDRGCTILLAVPLLFEVIARSMQEKLNDLPAPLRGFFQWGRKVTEKKPALGRYLLFPMHRAFGGRIRFFVAGGAKLQPWVYEFFHSLGFRMLQGYGLTETAPVLAVSSLRTTGPNHVGRPLRNIEIGIFDGNRKRLKDGKEGEVWARGGSVFAGYEDRAHNEKAFHEDWFRTGDLGRITPEGYLEITGRMKDIIVTPGGKNVYPEDLEALLAGTGKFLENTVIGIADDKGHEKITAVVRPDRTKFKFKDEQDLPKQVKATVREALRDVSDYMQPQRVEVLEQDFPKTHTKKVKRHELRAIIVSAGGSDGGETLSASEQLDPTDAVERAIGESISSILNKPFEQIRRDDTLVASLGLDSLTFVEVIGVVEKKFVLQVDDLEFSQVETVDDLVSAVQKRVRERGKAKKRRKAWFSEFPPTTGMKLRWLLPRAVMGRLIQLLLKVFCRISSRGVAYKSEDSSLVFTPNHASHFDTLALAATMQRKRWISTYAVAAKDYFFSSGWKAFTARLLLNAIPFDRKRRVEEGMAKCREILDDGGSLVIFPEGTRSVNGRIQEFKPGVGQLLCGNQRAKAVPVFIDGAYQVFPKGAAVPRPRKLRVVYGDPISFADLSPDADNYQVAAKRLQKAVEELRDRTLAGESVGKRIEAH